MKCPICQTDSPGAYCPACGAPLDGARCRSCETPLLPGARFCVHCGEPVRKTTASNLPWYVAGAALVAVLVVLAVPALRTGGAGAGGAAAGATGFRSPPAAPTGPAAATQGSAPPLTGTPREQADRLFNRVMQAIAQNDSAQASFFLPMAILAYRQAGELDADGLYHLSVLETAAGNAENGREAAERILETAPDHVLALGAAARAAALGGDRSAALRYYERLLRVFDAERARDLPEYRDHARILPEYRDEAAAFVSGG